MTSRLIQILFLLLAISISAKANTKEHLIERGETIESIAAHYGLTTDMLLLANPEMEGMFFSGMIIQIPVTKENTSYSTSNLHNSKKTVKIPDTERFFTKSSKENEWASKASAEFKKRNYGKSIKWYNKLVKKHPKALYVYNRGLAHYNKKKYRQAAQDLRKAIRMPDASESMKAEGPDLIAEAEHKHSVWQQQRAEMWAGIVTGVVSTGLSTWQAVETAKVQSNYTPRTTARSKKTNTQTKSGSSNNSKASSQQVWDHYLDPEVFVYNYSHGLPTLPSSSQVGLTGIDAYAYDVQNKLQYESQLMDLAAQKQTEQLVADGYQRAQKEIQNFKSIYGREPTVREIQEIYAKYTQGYVDAYSNYISDRGATDKVIDSSNTTNSSGSSSTKGTKKCGYCGGTGSIIKSVANFGIDKQPWCDKCGKNVVSGHYHQTCDKCHGTGET